MIRLPPPDEFDDWREWAREVIRAQAAEALPGSMLGTIAEFPLPLPSGWLPCDGSSFDTASYPELARILTTGVLPLVTAQYVPGGVLGGTLYGVGIRAL